MPADRPPSLRGRVVGLAVRPGEGQPMSVVESATAATGGWIEGDYGRSTKRGITFVAREAWDAANRELGSDLPWTARRANVCLEGLDLPALRGRRLRVGDVEVELLELTLPCGVMDRAHPGLKDALDVDGRCGVYGRVLEGGTIGVGDVAEVVVDAA